MNVHVDSNIDRCDSVRSALEVTFEREEKRDGQVYREDIVRV
jgi:hypothetical protein